MDINIFMELVFRDFRHVKKLLANQNFRTPDPAQITLSQFWLLNNIIS
jgi:hypothetical protein